MRTERRDFAGATAVAVRPAAPRAREARTKLLLVRHGDGRASERGRPSGRPRYMEPLLSHLARRDPMLRQDIDVWFTGMPQPDLDGVGAVVFLLQDPLRERFPDCFREACELAERARRIGARIVNPPHALSHSIKSTQSRLWRAQGLPTPAVIPFASLAEMRAAAGEVTYPAFVRADWLHVQQMRLVATRDELMQLAEHDVPVPGCLSPFVNTREGFRQQHPDSELARFYHKKRVWVFGSRVQRAHIFFGESPVVGSSRSTFGHYRSLNPIRRLHGRLACRRHVQLDYEFFTTPEPDPDIFVRAARALELEFAAIDYSSFADGRIVLWEANPHFALEQWPLEILARQRRVAERHHACHEAIREFFASLLECES